MKKEDFWFWLFPKITPAVTISTGIMTYPKNVWSEKDSSEATPFWLYDRLTNNFFSLLFKPNLIVIMEQQTELESRNIWYPSSSSGLIEFETQTHLKFEVEFRTIRTSLTKPFFKCRRSVSLVGSSYGAQFLDKNCRKRSCYNSQF